ncbi:MAG: response regulator [Cyanobacteria bacterium J06639_14]
MWDSAEILAIDDVPTNLDLIIDILSPFVHRVATVTSGERALKRLETQIPDLILLDIQMPGLDGFETCQKIKLNPQTANIPIIFVTARNDVNSIAEGFEMGAIDYISKPFHAAELIARVKTHLHLKYLHESLDAQIEKRTHQLQQTAAQLQVTVEQLNTSQLQLVSHEKMSSLGNLVAGIAHEINNPLGFVGGNIVVLKDYINNLTAYLQLYEKTYPLADNELLKKRKQLDIEFILEDLDRLLNSMTTGCDRISRISKSLRIFSRTDKECKFPSDIHEELDSTLHILQYRLGANDHRPAIEVIQDYNELPVIQCFPGQLSQAFMNILANAIDMFDEVAEEQTYETLQKNPQQITIRTHFIQQSDQVSRSAEICIRDNGKGMSEETCAKIFDRQFTTKVAPKGTGLGLAIARQIIVENHSGSVDVKSELGQGTEFRICIPIQA